jgi:SAM-dependent methyltransferase
MVSETELGVRPYSTIASYSDPRAVQGYLLHESRPFWDQFPALIIDGFAEAVRVRKPRFLDRPLVLNLGSGPGEDSQLLSERGLSVICYDGSPTMVQVTRQRGFESYQGDFRQIELVDGAFDGVWACKSLINIPRDDMFKTLWGIRDVLADGAPLCLGMIQNRYNTPYASTTSFIEGKPRHMSFYSEEELKRMLLNTGFETTAVAEMTRYTSSKYLFLIANKRP